MKTSARVGGAITVLLLTLTPGRVLGQPAGSASSSPATSPASSGTENPSGPGAVPPPMGPARSLPPGHPPIDGSTSPTRGPGPVDDPAIPPGTIVVEAKGLAPDLLRTLEANLVEWQRGEEAEVNVIERRSLGPSGSVQFSKVKQREEVAFSVVIDHQGVPYASPTFRLSDQAGKRVPVRLFAITSDMDRAQVGVQAFVYVEPRDHHMHVEQMFQFTNLSEETWRTHSMPVRLPPGARGVSSGEDSGPLTIKRVPDSGVMIEGVVPPGVVDMAFQYEVPYPKTQSLTFSLGMPPRVAAVRVMAALGPNLHLTVPGFGQPSSTRNEQGQRVLIVNHAVQPNDDQIENVTVTIDGLPAKSLPRWLALGFTLLLMAGGIAAAYLMKKRDAGNHPTTTVRQQRLSLLQEIAGIEEEYQQGNLSEEDFRAKRATLLNQLAIVLAKLESDQKNDAS